jgi:hypothetical protein
MRPRTSGYRSLAPLVSALALAGCASLLPTSQSEVNGTWSTFEEARAAIERIEAQRTTVADLKAAGIDPFTSTNVQLLSYSDVLLRFPINGGLAENRLDRGLAECLKAGKACTGYSIAMSDVKKDRVGPFWLDVFGFKRVAITSGWQFNALILLVDDRVVYTLYSGRPNVREHEVSRQPLGPIQNVGDALPSVGSLIR